MYNLPHFKEKDEAVVLRFMKDHPFALLTGVDEHQQPVATQVPFLFIEKEGQLYLRAHIMKGTDHHKAFTQNPHALVVFTGPHTYVSSSWYTNPQQGSTWNYMAVHARGEIHFLPDEELRHVLNALTDFYEKENSPALYQYIPEEYIARMTKAIVAFEIKVDSVEHVFKLSQNRDQQSFENILEKLDQGNEDARWIASEMKKRKDQFFPV